MSRALRERVGESLPALRGNHGNMRDALRIAFARSWLLEDRSGADNMLQAALHHAGRAVGTPLDPELAGFYVVNGDMARARRAAANGSHDRDPSSRHPWEMVPRAWIALADGNYQRAVELWRAETETGPCPVCSMWLVGLAYDRAALADSAIASYERYLTTPWLRKIVVDAYAKPHVLERLAGLYDAKRQPGRASAYYAAFVQLWPTPTRHCSPGSAPPDTA